MPRPDDERRRPLHDARRPRGVGAAVCASALLAAACAPLSRAATWTYGAALDVVLPVGSTLRLDLPHGVRAVRDRGAIVYAIPVADGVVLIDSGLDEAAAAPQRLVGDAPVRAVFLTHGHADHAAGARALGAPVHVGRADVAMVRDVACLRPWFTHALEHQLVLPIPPVVVPADDGDTFTVGGEQIRAVALPGHTEGSTAWLWRDVLFTGDAVFAMDGETLRIPPELVTDDEDRALASLRKLRDVDFAYLVDGHYGVTRAPQRKLAALLERGKIPFHP